MHQKGIYFRKKSQYGPTEIAFSGSCLQLSGLFRCLNAKEDQINYSVILRITDGASGILEILREILWPNRFNTDSYHISQEVQ